MPDKRNRETSEFPDRVAVVQIEQVLVNKISAKHAVAGQWVTLNVFADKSHGTIRHHDVSPANVSTGHHAASDQV